MNDPRGSVWRKWDLHVHTPDSLINSYGGAGAWDKFIEALSHLPPELKVLGINDYIFLDGYKKVVAAKAAGKLPNIDLLLPVIELRLDKFGGSKSTLSRVNYHVIFSNEIPPETIESQFLSALCSKYVLSPEYDNLRTSGKWVAVPTRQSIEDLGRLIIESVPAEETGKYHSPMIEGFNNLCLSLADTQRVLESHYFVGKTVTAVGKTEWADIKWNDQSIADKKTIINGADLVFISSATVADWTKARKSLTEGSVNDRLLDCSDAHRYADSTDKDRLGKCFTWVKADPSFEGLRQAIFEYLARVAISEDRPLEPLLTIRSATVDFPTDTTLKSGDRDDDFCFRGHHEVKFSPYFTCIVGGRGTGKSTLLNLLHEKTMSGTTSFFRDNVLQPIPSCSVASCVAIDAKVQDKEIEFLQQNEIEELASDHTRLTVAIFARLIKLDSEGRLINSITEIQEAKQATEEQISRIKAHHTLSLTLEETVKELSTNKALIESFQNDDYQKINKELASTNKELLVLRLSRSRLENLSTELKLLLAKYPASTLGDLNPYEQQLLKLVDGISREIDSSTGDPSLDAAIRREQEIAGNVTALRKQLESFLKQRGLSAENLADVGKATERVTQLEEELPQLEVKLAGFEKDIADFTSKRNVATKYANTVETLLAPINKQLQELSTEVKPIEMRYQFEFAEAREFLVQHLRGALGEEARIRADYVESVLQNVDLTSLSTLDDLIQKIPEGPQKTGKALRDYVSLGVNFEVLKLQVELQLLDVQRYGKIRTSYDGKPIENTSFGQRCTAVIVVLLLLGNTPIIIDEPEAHLDSGLIAKYLVELVKVKKKDRQIVFATHNANFVINGDAELIHCLSMNDNKTTEIVSTTIEDLQNRNLLLGLEGGKEAFQRRERRYGIQ